MLGPWPAGGPPPWPCWASAGRLSVSDVVVRAVIRTKCLCFTDSSCDLQWPAQGWSGHRCLAWGQYYCISMMPPFEERMQGQFGKRPEFDTPRVWECRADYCKWRDSDGLSRLSRCTVWRQARRSTMPIRIRARLRPDQIPNAPQLRAKQSHTPSGRPITQ